MAFDRTALTDVPGSGAEQDPSPARKRVLFVDDEPEVLDGLRDALRRYRRVWDMRFAGGGAEALALLEGEPADVIVTDVQMPGMDGG